VDLIDDLGRAVVPVGERCGQKLAVCIDEAVVDEATCEPWHPGIGAG